PAGSHTVVALPKPFDAWLAQQPLGAPGRDPHALPWYPRRALPGCHADAGQLELVIDEPRDGAVLLATRTGASEQLLARARAVGGSTPEVIFVLDGRPLGRSSPPFRAELPLEP